ncbi:uncharacterized protein K452DRAFT_219546, partial [Aplosporella prunicola CBS 121167]
RRIYILGTGSIGKFVAHSLRSIPNPPPVTLLFHKPSLLKEWHAAGEEIRLSIRVALGQRADVARNGFDVELAMPNRREHGKEIEYAYDPLRTFTPKPQKETEELPNNYVRDDTLTDEPIDSLIVTTKAFSTVSALSAIQHRLLPTSTILFLQNGMGVSDEVSRVLFPDEAARPKYLQGVVSHGVSSQTPFSAKHTGTGTIQMGPLPRPDSDEDMTQMQSFHSLGATSHYLLRTLARTPALCAVSLSPVGILCSQLEKLAVNCVINPLTSLTDARNGSLLYNFSLTRVQRLLLSEISVVIRSLPELRGVLNINTRFSPDRLETLTTSIAAKTAENTSSMLNDVRRGLRTEVDYINGYIVRRGEEIGMRCVMNYMVTNLVKGKQQLISKEIAEDAALLGDNPATSLERGEGYGKPPPKSSSVV